MLIAALTALTLAVTTSAAAEPQRFALVIGNNTGDGGDEPLRYAQADAIAFLQKNGVKIDGSTQKKSDEQINGMDMTNFDWTGKDDDGDVNVGLSLLSPKAGKLLVITYWGSQGTQEAHGAELQGIISSLKAAE